MDANDFKKLINRLMVVVILGLSAAANASLAKDKSKANQPLTPLEIGQALGWVVWDYNRCSGYYLESGIPLPSKPTNKNTISIVTNQFLFSLHSTSETQGKITIRRYGQEVTANKAYLYRNPKTGKTNAIDLIGHVILREPNTYILAKSGHLDHDTKTASLYDLLYRTVIYTDSSQYTLIHGTPEDIAEQRIIDQLSGWGQASAFNQLRPKIYAFDNASYSTCPPISKPAWQVKASHIDLNKETGRGLAHHARLLLKGVPVLYTPLLSFPLDHRRQTGFLWPTPGVSNTAGPYLATPFYWNMAPNYDMTITPMFLAKSGVQLTGLYRYLTQKSNGQIKLSILPDDRAFMDFQSAARQNTIYNTSTNPATQAELNRLLSASPTRKLLSWQNQTYFNPHWDGNVDYTYVSDDYYFTDLSTSITDITQINFLQKLETNYKDQYFNVIGRLQSYQTLHPINTSQQFQNQYSRFPQLLFNANYPSERTGIEYGIEAETTRFTIQNNPGQLTKSPVGNRLNLQPSITRPINLPYFFLNPRIQFPMTKYELGNVLNGEPKYPTRTIPIFDVSAGLYFDRHLNFFNLPMIQTLEPVLYYVYAPFKDQNNLPIFDTNVNQLTYDQLFVYNRFSDIDRIEDADRLSAGITTRFIREDTGDEKIRLGVGGIYYFKKRQVALCGPNACPEPPTSPSLRQTESPLSGLLSYSVNPNWTLTANTIWDPSDNELDNQTLTLHFQPADNRIINLGYTFVRNGDVENPSVKIDKTSNNLSQTDLSGAWPLFRDWSVVARWTQNLNRHYFQNLLGGVQYDSCCWAVRIVAGREFTGLNTTNTAQYNTLFFIQFALKGLGNIGQDPTSTLSSDINGYRSQFGQGF